MLTAALLLVTLAASLTLPGWSYDHYAGFDYYADYEGYEEYDGYEGYDHHGFQSFASPTPALSGFSPRDVIFQSDGGEPVTTPRYGYVVALSKHGTVHCSGWLYMDNLVVTAAHCLPEDETQLASLQVYLGRYELSDEVLPDQIYGVTAAVKHPNYNDRTNEYDVALVELDDMAGKNHSVFLARLQTEEELLELRNTSELVLLGWGGLGCCQNGDSMGSRYLQKGILSHEPREKCNTVFKHVGIAVTDIMVCATGGTFRDACAGDGGAPLIIPGERMERDVVVGVVSWGYDCSPGRPGVYTSMAKVRNWVEWQSDRM